MGIICTYKIGVCSCIEEYNIRVYTECVHNKMGVFSRIKEYNIRGVYAKCVHIR